MNVIFHITIDNIKIFENMRKSDENIKMIDMCQEFIKTCGNYIKITNPNEEENNENEENEENKDNEDEEENKDNKDNENKNKDNEDEEENKIEENEEDKKEDNKNVKIIGSESTIKKNEDKKTSFISLKMQIDTVLMFKLLIALMIITIVMIIIFILKIEFKPLINYKIPDDYKHFTIQPPVYNVKNYSIFNKDKGILSSLKDIKNNFNKDTPKQSIKEEIISDVKPVMVDSEQSKNIKSEYFSSSYEFGI